MDQRGAGGLERVLHTPSTSAAAPGASSASSSALTPSAWGVTAGCSTAMMMMMMDYMEMDNFQQRSSNITVLDVSAVPEMFLCPLTETWSESVDEMKNQRHRKPLHSVNGGGACQVHPEVVHVFGRNKRNRNRKRKSVVTNVGLTHDAVLVPVKRNRRRSKTDVDVGLVKWRRKTKISSPDGSSLPRNQLSFSVDPCRPL